MQIHFSFTAHSVNLSLVILLCMGVFACAPQPEQIKPTEAVESLPVVKPSVPSKRNNSAVTALIKQADALIKKRNWQEAASVIERAIRIDSNQADSWTRMAIISLGKNNPEQAIQMAQKSNSLARNNKSLQAWNWSLISRAYTSLHKPDLAQQAAQTSKNLQQETK